MTSSRTYWVAVIVAAGLTFFFYHRASRIWILTATIATFIAIATVAAFDIQFDTKGIGRLIRSESVSNLTGRVDVWERAVKAFELRPYLGYGFTAGALGLEEETNSGAFGEAPELSSRVVGRTTMHSGFVQSLLDSGAIGTVFYVLAIVLSIRTFYRYDKKRAFPAEFGALIFLSVANLSENAIYAASVFSSVLFWILALFAFSLKGARDSPDEHKLDTIVSDAVKAKLVSDSRARHFLYPPQSS
jgi:O-antigen ligase